MSFYQPADEILTLSCGKTLRLRVFHGFLPEGQKQTAKYNNL